MNRFTGKGQFLPWEKGAVMAVPSTQTLTIRSERLCAVYRATDRDFSDELLVGLSNGEQQVVVDYGYVRVESQKRVWLAVTIADQSVEWGDEIFTTLDRPSQLSPEMQALQRFARQNEMERNADRAEIARLRARPLSRDVETPRDVPADAKTDRADGQPHGDAEPKKPKSGTDREATDAEPSNSGSGASDTDPPESDE